MDCQSRRLRIDPKHGEFAKAHSSDSDLVSELLQSLRIATSQALSRLERMAQFPTRDFHRAVRELKVQQRRLRFVRSKVDA
jgi:hypothetical protein